MKAINTKNRIKFIAITVAVVLAFIMSAVFPFVFTDVKHPTAAGEEEAASREDGIRFVQVAAGEDFAIGLTFDGRLFGWSLNTADSTRVLSKDATSLGDYYSVTPTEIPVVFRNGPINGYDWTNHAQYHDQKTQADPIVSIAATRTTAAFITQSGYIYTWGKDETKDIDNAYNGLNDKPHYLLLRPTTRSNKTQGDEAWYIPYIVNYGYYGKTGDESGNTSGLYKIIPSGWSDVSLAAGENNYIVVFKQSSAYYSYVWGSLMYANVNVTGKKEGYNFDSKNDTHQYKVTDGAGYRNLYKTQYGANGTEGTFIEGTVRAVAGGYNVGMNASIAGSATNVTSLMLRGKNFLTSQGVAVADKTLTPVVTVATNEGNYGAEGTKNGTSNVLFKISSDYNTVKNAVLGGYYSNQIKSDVISWLAADATNNMPDLYYARPAYKQGGGTDNLIFTTGALTANTSGIYGSDGVSLTNQQNANATIIRNAVSLGNDIGYGIDGDGKLYAWGDNSCGQSGLGMPAEDGSVKANYAYPEQTLKEKGKIISVAAGKQISASKKAFNATDTLNAASNGVMTFTDDVKNGTDYISGAVASDGKLYVWSGNVANGAVKEIVYGMTCDANGSEEVSSNNRFVAVYSGYKNELFAVTKLGKLIRVTVKDGAFTQIVYDTFKSVNGADAIAQSLNVTADGEPSTKWTEIVNWNVASNSLNSANKSAAKFTVKSDMQPSKANPNPSLGNMTFFVDNAYADLTSISLNDQFAQAAPGEGAGMVPLTYAGKSRTSLVSTNGMGDAFRILDYNNDASIRYADFMTRGTGAAALDTLSGDQLKPKFWFKAKGETDFVEMDDEQCALLFDYGIVYDNTYGVGIKITPKQSTKNGTVNMRFYIARYSCASDFVISENKRPTKSNALYYDYSECNVEFKVDNSTPYKNYESFDSDNAGKSSIPLLDPNNEYNKFYSLAVQDVSTGVTELVSELKETDNAGFTQAIIQAMKAGDPGYPDSDKVAKGNLNYYLGNKIGTVANALYYNDKYDFLLADRDADYLALNIVTPSPTNQAANGSVDWNKKKITVTLDSEVDPENEEKFLVSSMGITRATAQSFFKHFDNKYGLYDIVFTYGTGDTENTLVKISFSYDVLTFEAKGTTGKLSYGEDEKTASVAGFLTTNIASNAYMSYDISYNEYITYTKDFIVNRTASDTADVKPSASDWVGAVSVFSQASVRLNKSHKANNNLIYGAAASDTGYTANNHLDVIDTKAHIVGDPAIVINLSDYVDVAGTFISFSYKNSVASLSDFDKEFPNSNGKGNYIKLESDKVTVSFNDAHAIYFTVTIQRFFYKGDNRFAFPNNDEKVTISFSFTNIKSVEFSSTLASADKPRVYSISRESYIYIFGKNSAPENIRSNVLNAEALVSLNEKYRGSLTMTQPKSSSNDILSIVEYTKDFIRVKPDKSGSAIVQFTLTAYGTSIPITLKFNVRGITAIKDLNAKGDEEDYTVNLANTKYIYVSELKTGLKNTVGSFSELESNATDDFDLDNYVILYSDINEETIKDEQGNETKQTQFNAITFKKVNYELDRETETDVPNYYPPFVKSVMFQETGSESKAYIRLEVNPLATDFEGTYRMYIKFVDKQYKTYAEAEAAQDGIILQTTILVKSNLLVAQEGSNPLIIKADCDNPKKPGSDKSASWYMESDEEDLYVYVPLRYLCTSAGITDYENYEIFLVRADSDTASNYINAVGGTESTKDILNIKTIYNTPETVSLDVSIRHKGNSSTQVISFGLEVGGISTTLSGDEYTKIWLVAFFSSLGLLMVIFLIRMIIFWRRRAKQRALIKRNQELIRMRDRIHNKTTAATREQVVKTKLKMQDPKYAKMFSEMKADKNGGVSVTSDTDDFGVSDDNDKKGKKKKKGGKKSMAELKAELAAKKAAFAQAQNATANNFGAAEPNAFGGVGAEPVDFAGQPQNFDQQASNFGSPTDAFNMSDLNGDAIIFDAPDIDDGMQG